MSELLTFLQERELRDREKYHVDMAKWKLEEKEQQSFDSNQQQSQASTVSQSQSTVQNAQQKLYQGDIIIKNVVQSSMSALKRPCTDASGTNNSYNTSSNPSQISQTFTNQQGSGTFTENEMKTKMTLDFLDLNSWDEAHAQYGVTGNGDVLHALMNQQQNQHHQAQQQPVQGNNATNNNKVCFTLKYCRCILTLFSQFKAESKSSTTRTRSTVTRPNEPIPARPSARHAGRRYRRRRK